MIVISDTSVITNLAAIQHLPLLTQLYRQVIIPEAVYLELADIDPPVPGALEAQSAAWLQAKQVTDLRGCLKSQRESQVIPME